MPQKPRIDSYGVLHHIIVQRPVMSGEKIAEVDGFELLDINM